MTNPLRRSSRGQTKDPQRVRRVGKLFDSFGNLIPTTEELEGKIVALETQNQNNATKIEEIAAALKKAGLM